MLDAGKEKLEMPLTDEEKKLASLAMGTNAALVQFVLEGIIPANQQMHFMMHLMDYIGRLYAGKEISFLGVDQTYNLNSVAGKLYADAAVDSLNNGEANAAKLKENMVRLQKMMDEQTNKDDEEGENFEVTQPETPKRYLN